MIEFVKQVGEKKIKCQPCQAFYRFFCSKFFKFSKKYWVMNVRFYLSYDIEITVKSFKSHFGVKTLGFGHIHVTLKASFHIVTL